MNCTFRQGTTDDLNDLKKLALASWSRFQHQLTAENWTLLHNNLSNEHTFTELLSNSYCIICSTEEGRIIGMAFLVPSGNPTEIYDKDWCYIRYVSVDPDFDGQGIGKKLTALCIEKAKQDGEKTIALHTSELMANARHIYESMGFSILREIEQRLGMRYWLYTLQLEEGNEKNRQ